MDVVEELYGSSHREFDALLADVGAHLFGASPQSLHEVLSDALSSLLDLLDVDLAAIRLVDTDDGSARITHSAAAVGMDRYAPGVADIPWPSPSAHLRAEGAPIVVWPEHARPAAIPEWSEARRHGVTSAAFLPVLVSDRFLGDVMFATVGRARSLEPACVDRLRLVTQVIASALLRLDHERAVRTILTDVTALQERLHAENEHLRAGTLSPEGCADIVGESAELRAVLLQAEQVAVTDATVLLLGETGTGKELIAKSIHGKSPRRHKALVKVNCAALPPTLIESELFGHEKGAFTGAASRRIGRFELADEGTLFLDEIGELPLELQAKLLRVLQEGEFERLGSTVTHKVDVRIIAASNRDLAAAAHQGTFRSDLYYRIGVFPIRIPPLRARKDDIPLLVWHALGQCAGSLGKAIERIPAATMERLIQYDWPGNIRELRNVIERAAILSPGPTLFVEDLANPCRLPTRPASAAGALRALADVERDHILHVLETCRWRVRGPGNAAEHLGLNASTLYSRMKKLGIRRESAVPPGA